MWIVESELVGVIQDVELVKAADMYHHLHSWYT
jgi:hypothetical protein